MKYPVCGIVVYLICHALLFAANTSAQQNKRPSGPVGGWEPGGHKLACTEKNPAPKLHPSSAPRLVTPPTYSEEARKAKIEGSVILGLIVDERGNPTNFRVIEQLGHGAR